jgi:hypothetical protein
MYDVIEICLTLINDDKCKSSFLLLYMAPPKSLAHRQRLKCRRGCLGDSGGYNDAGRSARMCQEKREYISRLVAAGSGGSGQDQGGQDEERRKK